MPIIIEIHHTGIGSIVEVRNADTDEHLLIFETVFETERQAERYIETLEQRFDVLKVIEHA